MLRRIVNFQEEDPGVEIESCEEEAHFHWTATIRAPDARSAKDAFRRLIFEKTGAYPFQDPYIVVESTTRAGQTFFKCFTYDNRNRSLMK